MDRKKKLETSLEGLFSKSKGAQKPAEVENKAVPPVPTAVEKLKKSTAAVKKSEPKPADQKDEKKTAKKMAGGAKGS